MKMIGIVDREFNASVDGEIIPFDFDFLEWWHREVGDKAVVIGRVTYELNGKIGGRKNYILSRGGLVLPRDSELKVIDKPMRMDAVVIGGISTFYSFLPLVDEVALYIADTVVSGVTKKFPKLKDFEFVEDRWIRNG